MLYLGMSSWTKLGENEEFYPRDITEPRERLQYYSKRYTTVEIDSSTQGFLDKQNTKLWAYRTTADFIFHLRAHSSLTFHAVNPKKLPARILRMMSGADRAKKYLYISDRNVIEAIAEEFRKSLELLFLLKKLGHIVFFFPPWVSLKQEYIDHIMMCRKIMPEFRLAVEFGHGSWLEGKMRKKVLDFLERFEITYVVSDQPQFANAATAPFYPHITTDTAYVRLNGRSPNWLKKGISPIERYDYLYTVEDLRNLMDPILDLERKSRNTFVIFNNLKDGQASLNGAMFGEMLAEEFAGSGKQANL